MNLDLSPAESAFRADVRRFLAKHLTTEMIQGQRMNASVFPPPAISMTWQRILGERGWAAPLWPVEYGGTGWTPIERFIFESECAAAGAPLLSPLGIRLVAPVILAFGTDAQKATWLPRILSGEDYWCQGFSEPGAGSDLAALSTRADRDGDDYVVNGSKIWTTHAHFATHMFTLVRTSHQGPRQDGISFLATELDRPGVDIRPILSLSGEHDLNQVFLTDVRVPRRNLIGEENKGWEYAKYLLEFERGTGLFSGRLRSAIKRVETALEARGYALDDHAFEEIASVAIDIDTFEMLELMTLGTLPPGERPGPASSMLKLRASRLKQRVGELAMTLLGEDALRWPQEPVDTCDVLVLDYLNGRAATIFGGTSEVQLNIIARTLLPH